MKRVPLPARFINNPPLDFLFLRTSILRQRENENSPRYFYVYFRCIASATRLLGSLVAWFRTILVSDSLHSPR